MKQSSEFTFKFCYSDFIRPTTEESAKMIPDNTKTVMSGQVGAKCSQVREQKTFIEAERRQKQRQRKHRTISGHEHSSGKTRCR